LKIILFLKCCRKICASFQRIIELFIQKIVTKLSKTWFWDPGVKKALDPGSGSATLATTSCVFREDENENLVSFSSQSFLRRSEAKPDCLNQRCQFVLKPGWFL
jgi:hypothetical protein